MVGHYSEVEEKIDKGGSGLDPEIGFGEGDERTESQLPADGCMPGRLD